MVDLCGMPIESVKKIWNDHQQEEKVIHES